MHPLRCSVARGHEATCQWPHRSFSSFLLPTYPTLLRGQSPSRTDSRPAIGTWTLKLNPGVRDDSPGLCSVTPEVLPPPPKWSSRLPLMSQQSFSGPQADLDLPSRAHRHWKQIAPPGHAKAGTRTRTEKKGTTSTSLGWG
ncbi:hypothetical protein CKAH01_04166 [Colletotrichum kahawae]|uniref:Uncharacterized protein n=1 Tax=Colletotrichum kahawae TaxID=34407 RepID=A0AAE0D8U2_COLKA|nr:hypothetical protein CKAH01_04166 [Colletotrichum kahawae]